MYRALLRLILTLLLYIHYADGYLLYCSRTAQICSLFQNLRGTIKLVIRTYR